MSPCASPARSLGASERSDSIWSTPGIPIQNANPHQVNPKKKNTGGPNAVMAAAGPIEASHHPGRLCLEESRAPRSPPAAFKLNAMDAAKFERP